jgi:hypothetical protein
MLSAAAVVRYISHHPDGDVYEAEGAPQRAELTRSMPRLEKNSHTQTPKRPQNSHVERR